MSQSNPIQAALCDLCDDIAYHAVNLAHGAFDLLCLLTLGALVYASGIDAADAGLQGRAMFGVRASIEAQGGPALSASPAPTSCTLTNDLLSADHSSCIQTLVLEPADS